MPGEAASVLRYVNVLYKGGRRECPLGGSEWTLKRRFSKTSSNNIPVCSCVSDFILVFEDATDLKHLSFST